MDREKYIRLCAYTKRDNQIGPHQVDGLKGPKSRWTQKFGDLKVQESEGSPSCISDFRNRIVP